MRVGPARVPRIPRIAMERTAYGRTNASLTRLRGSAQRPAEGKGLDRGFSLRQNLTPNRTARLVISGGSIVTPGATSIMVNPKRKKNVGIPTSVAVYPCGAKALWSPFPRGFRRCAPSRRSDTDSERRRGKKYCHGFLFTRIQRVELRTLVPHS